ncbi:hypothetical protein [Actinoplanes regularis]|uniref:Uncharacterized protein n=1 Tax=Actinoplanes regularis TaxID=52697 RepID=A0A239G1T0_9ACTN|nr:hypothetical protein [Actinoplanes regularis]SNS62935.1 hypothetical protein SAMN06264365_119151 [Actinoplanes regularis]
MAKTKRHQRSGRRTSQTKTPPKRRREREWHTWSLEKWIAVLGTVTSVAGALVSLVYWAWPGAAKQIAAREASCGFSDHGRVLLDAAWLTVPADAAADSRPAVTGACNSRGGDQAVTRRARGSYEVRLQDLGVDSGTVEVTAVSGAHRVCGAGGWGRTPRGLDLRVLVNCVDEHGVPADSGFALRFLQAFAGTGTLAYLRYDLGAATPFFPAANYSFNSFNAPNSVERRGRGVYEAYLQGVQRSAESRMPGVVKVTPVGDAVQVCNPAVWYPYHQETTGVDSMFVKVECFDASGAPVDSGFTLTYSVDLAAPPGIIVKGAQLWTDDAGARRYTPNSLYQFTSAGRLAMVERRSTGDYLVKMPDAALTDGGHTQVSAYHTSATCHPDAVPAQRDGAVTVRVRCLASGTPVDARFALLFQS